MNIGIIDRIRPAIVAVLHPDGKPSGTGFFVSSDGYILTCYHVIEPSIRASSIILVETTGGIFEVEFMDKLSRIEPCLDFAILKVKESREFAYLPIGTDSNNGDLWCTLGFELSKRYKGVPNGGKIEGPATCNCHVGHRDIILRSDNPILGGLSGSPVFNKGIGKVIGLIKEELSGTQGHAISIETILHIYPQLELLFCEKPDKYLEYHTKKYLEINHRLMQPIEDRIFKNIEKLDLLRGQKGNNSKRIKKIEQEVKRDRGELREILGDSCEVESRSIYRLEVQ